MVPVVKNSPANAGDIRDNPWVGEIPGGGHGSPLQYSCLVSSMDRGAWWASVRRVAELNTTEVTSHTHTHTDTQTHTHTQTHTDTHTHTHTHARALLAQTVKNLPGIQETWEDLEREWLPTPVFLPGESHGQRSLVGYNLWLQRVGHD